ncbi:uncharacterized protein AAES06_021642 [Glossophaga mutica]
METKNPARCTMSMSATHTSGFNTGSDNQNKWLLFPLYSTCQHSPLKGGGGGDARGLGSDAARPALGRGAGSAALGSPDKYLLCRRDWEPGPAPEGGHGGAAFPPLEPGPGAGCPRETRLRGRLSARGAYPAVAAARPPGPPGLPARNPAGPSAQASPLPPRADAVGWGGKPDGPWREVFGKASRDFEDVQSEPNGPGSRPGPPPPRQPQPRGRARRGAGGQGGSGTVDVTVDVTVEPAGGSSARSLVPSQPPSLPLPSSPG